MKRSLCKMIPMFAVVVAAMVAAAVTSYGQEDPGKTINPYVEGVGNVLIDGSVIGGGPIVVSGGGTYRGPGDTVPPWGWWGPDSPPPPPPPPPGYCPTGSSCPVACIPPDWCDLVKENAIYTKIDWTMLPGCMDVDGGLPRQDLCEQGFVYVVEFTVADLLKACEFKPACCEESPACDDDDECTATLCTPYQCPSGVCATYVYETTPFQYFLGGVPTADGGKLDICGMRFSVNGDCGLGKEFDGFENEYFDASPDCPIWDLLEIQYDCGCFHEILDKYTEYELYGSYLMDTDVVFTAIYTCCDEDGDCCCTDGENYKSIGGSYLGPMDTGPLTGSVPSSNVLDGDDGGSGGSGTVIGYQADEVGGTGNGGVVLGSQIEQRGGGGFGGTVISYQVKEGGGEGGGGIIIGYQADEVSAQGDGTATDVDEESMDDPFTAATDDGPDGANPSPPSPEHLTVTIDPDWSGPRSPGEAIPATDSPGVALNPDGSVTLSGKEPIKAAKGDTVTLCNWAHCATYEWDGTKWKFKGATGGTK